MTNTDSPFGYTHDGTPVLDGVAGWEDYEGVHHAAPDVTPARVLQPGEVAVKRYLASDAVVHLASIRPFTSDRLRAALDAQSEPATDEPRRDSTGCAYGCGEPADRTESGTDATEPADQGEEDCDNCGNQKCMSCALRWMHDECEDDCPDCCTEPARPSLPEFDADGRRIRCAKCDAAYDESRDAWGVCGKAECWPGSAWSSEQGDTEKEDG